MHLRQLQKSVTRSKSIEEFMRLCLENAEVYDNSGNRFLEHAMFLNSLLPLEQHDCPREQLDCYE